MRTRISPIRTAPPLRGRRGAVLVMSLLLLAMITILGVYAATRTAVEEKVAGASVSATRVFYVAEAALSHGEKMLNEAMAVDPANLATLTSPQATWDFALVGATNSYCETGCGTTADLVNGAWVAGGALLLDTTTLVDGVSYTYTVTVYDNDETNVDDPNNTGTNCAADPANDCDGSILIRATARAWNGAQLLAESIQERTLTSTKSTKPGTMDSTTGEGGGVGKSYTATGTGTVDMSGGGTVM